MIDDSLFLYLYNEEGNVLVHFLEYKRLLVKGQIYALLQPEHDPDRLMTFRVEEVAGSEGEEVYIYVVDPGELGAVDEAWQKLHS